MLIGKNITVDGFRTSIRLEAGMWEALDEICRHEGLGYNDICSLDACRSDQNRTSAIRSYIVAYFRKAGKYARSAGEDAGEKLRCNDPLTGAASRLSLLPRLEQERQRMKRSGGPCAIAAACIDDLEGVNARFGREAGDRALQIFAEHLLCGVRANDLVFRLHGNEFLIILPGAGAAKAKQGLDRLRRTLARREIPGKGGQILTITASFAIVSMSAGASPDDIITLASEAVRSVKARRGNQTCIWEGESGKPAKTRRSLELAER